MKRCMICGQPAENHHVVFGRGCRWDDDWNIVPLCPLHHRGNPGGVHFDRAFDLWLKTRLQARLKHLLLREEPQDQPFVQERPHWIQQGIWLQLIKPLQWDDWGGGYPLEDLLRRMMGGKLYG